MKSDLWLKLFALKLNRVTLMKVEKIIPLVDVKFYLLFLNIILYIYFKFVMTF